MQSDPLADFLTCIRNAARASKTEVRVPWSRMRSDVAHILKNEGYVTDVEKVNDEKAKAGKPELLVKLRGQGKTRAITQITRVSKPGPPPVRRRRGKSRACSAAWASQSSRRRAASWPATRPRNRTSAANCCSRFTKSEVKLCPALVKNPSIFPTR